MAAGPWVKSLLPTLPVPLRVTRQAMAWFTPTDAAAFAPQRFPVFLLESRHGMSEEQAYFHLRVKSRTSRRRLSEVAQELLAVEASALQEGRG